MRRIAMINQKGGVGKTTTAVNVAAGLARQGLRVLLLDLDPQSHATMHVGVEPGPDKPSIYDVLISGSSVAESLCDVSENLTVIPSHIDLVGAEVELAGRAERELILRAALQPLRERFDILIMDCPPSLGVLTVNALAAVEEIIIPLQPHFLALQGLGMLLETVTLVRGVLNPPLRIAGIVLCLYDRGTRLAQEVATDVRQFIASASPEDAWHGARVFETTIRRNVKLAECPSFGRTIFDYAPSSHGAEDYATLVREMLAPLLASAAERAGGPAESAECPSPAPASATRAAEVLDASGEDAQPLVARQASADVEAVTPAGSRGVSGHVSGAPDPLSPPPPADSPTPVAPDAMTP